MSTAAIKTAGNTMCCRAPLIVCGLLAATSCSESEIDSLAGQWSGEIVCVSGRHELTLTLEVFDEHVSGQGFTRTSNLDKGWQVSGGQVKEDRKQPCSNDTCTSTEQCVARGGSSCDSRGKCLDCVETIRVSIVELTLEDEDIQLVNPTMALQRMGADRLEGTIESFCPTDDRGRPTVTLSKQ